MNIDTVRAAGAIVIGVVLIVQGARVRMGAARGWVTRAQTPGYPAIARNAPFIAIPTGLLFIGGGLLYLLPNTGSLGAARLVIGLGLIPLLPLVLIGLSFPPRLLMPDWYRESQSIPERDQFDWIVIAFTAVATIVAACASLVLAASVFLGHR